MGWIEGGNDGRVRVARSVEGVPDGTELVLRLHALKDDFAQEIADRVAEGWSDCGVQVEVVALPAAELFAGWGEGPVFSRTYDAVLWGWPAFASPPCEMFAGWEISDGDHPLGVNASGLQDEAYDRACRQLLLSPPGTPEYEGAVREAQSRFHDLLPGLPLFVRPQFVAHRDWLCGVQPDASATTVLWNVESIRACP